MVFTSHFVNKFFQSGLKDGTTRSQSFNSVTEPLCWKKMELISARYLCVKLYNMFMSKETIIVMTFFSKNFFINVSWAPLWNSQLVSRKLFVVVKWFYEQCFSNKFFQSRLKDGTTRSQPLKLLTVTLCRKNGTEVGKLHKFCCAKSWKKLNFFRIVLKIVTLLFANMISSINNSDPTILLSLFRFLDQK